MAYVQGVAADEDDDNAFCERMYRNYLNAPEKGKSYTLKGCKKEWGLIDV